MGVQGKRFSWKLLLFQQWSSMLTFNVCCTIVRSNKMLLVRTPFTMLASENSLCTDLLMRIQSCGFTPSLALPLCAHFHITVIQDPCVRSMQHLGVKKVILVQLHTHANCAFLTLV